MRVFRFSNDLIEKNILKFLVRAESATLILMQIFHVISWRLKDRIPILAESTTE